MRQTCHYKSPFTATSFTEPSNQVLRLVGSGDLICMGPVNPRGLNNFTLE